MASHISVPSVRITSALAPPPGLVGWASFMVTTIWLPSNAVHQRVTSARSYGPG